MRVAAVRVRLPELDARAADRLAFDVEDPAHHVDDLTGMAQDDRELIVANVGRALHKRPVPTEYVDRAIEHIVQKILAQGEREVNARDLGESVMQELKAMDKVAYIRFASVYRSFQDVDDFNNVIRDL